VLDTLRSRGEPATMGELTESTGLHANTLRDHLDSLERSGLVERRRAAPTGPGRPAWLYCAAADDRPAGSEYAGLAAALAASIHRSSSNPRADAVAAGEEWGRDLARAHGRPARPGAAAARREVVAVLDGLGFGPETGDRSGTVRLTRCPLLDAAHRYPDVVCGVHLGIARGALEVYDADPERAELIPFAEPGACLLHLGRS
jgi:predicted ArsR family transcriptional regulator